MDEPLKDFTQHRGEREGAKSRGVGFWDERNQCVSPGDKKRRLQEHPVVKGQKKDPRTARAVQKDQQRTIANTIEARDRSNVAHPKSSRELLIGKQSIY